MSEFVKPSTVQHAARIETASRLLLLRLYYAVPSGMDSASDWFHPDECEYRDQDDGRDSHLTELLDDITTLGGCSLGVHLTVARWNTLHGLYTAQELLESDHTAVPVQAVLSSLSA